MNLDTVRTTFDNAIAPSCAKLTLLMFAGILGAVAAVLIIIGMVCVVIDFIVSAKNRWRQR